MTNPIEISDDGLRHMQSTTINGLEYHTFHNPSVIANALAEKAYRRSIKQANVQRYT